MHLADLNDLRGDYAKAEELYREILKDEPGNVVALNNLAWLLAQKTGEGAEALQCVEAAVNGIGRRADLLDTRGTVRLSLGQNAAALADFADAVSDTPTAARLFHLARRSSWRATATPPQDIAAAPRRTSGCNRPASTRPSSRSAKRC